MHVNSSLALCLSKHASTGYDRLKTWKYWRQKLSLGGLFRIQKKYVSPLFTYENNWRVSCKNNVFWSNISTAVLPWLLVIYFKWKTNTFKTFFIYITSMQIRIKGYRLISCWTFVLPPWKVFRNTSLLFFSQALFNRSKRCYYNEL